MYLTMIDKKRYSMRMWEKIQGIASDNYNWILYDTKIVPSSIHNDFLTIEIPLYENIFSGNLFEFI